MTLSAEASLARYIAKREKFQPGDNLLELVKKYADVEYLQFPVETVDGISLYLKSPDRRPNIIINSRIATTRGKFTLAHEFGHVLIPWHSGTIFSNIDAYSRSTNSAYREMEAEANRFAAELLMPQQWLEKLHTDNSDPVKIAQDVQRICGTSNAAAVIALNNALPPGYVYVCSNASDETVKRSSASQGTFMRSFSLGEKYLESAKIHESTKIYRYQVRDEMHVWISYEQEKEIAIVDDNRPWRKILNLIVDEVDPEHSQENIKASVNAIISACNKRDVPAKTFYAAARQRIASHGPLYQRILAHPQFEIFLVKRIEELVARRK